jgi:hypothetical protein
MVCVRSWKAEKGSVERQSFRRWCRLLGRRQRGDKRKKKSARKCRIPSWSLNHSGSRKQNLHRKASLKQETRSEIRNFPQDPQVLLALLSSLGGHAKTDRREISEKKSRWIIYMLFFQSSLKIDDWGILSQEFSQFMCKLRVWETLTLYFTYTMHQFKWRELIWACSLCCQSKPNGCATFLVQVIIPTVRMIFHLNWVNQAECLPGYSSDDLRCSSKEIK